VTALPGATKSGSLSTAEREVWKIDAVPCGPGDVFNLSFEEEDTRWRHGVFLAVEGRLRVADTTAKAVTIWSDTAPETTRVEVIDSDDGLLRVYNVWDSGRGRGTESQSATSGMLREVADAGWRYRCSDINPDPTFDALVFRLQAIR